MLDARAREALAGVYALVGRGLARAGFSANVLTVLGIALSAVGAWQIAIGELVTGGIILAVGSILDFCDGAVAKAKGTASMAGAFLDSVSDRVSDALVLSALAWYFFVEAGDKTMAAVTLAAYGLAVLTPYLRAKAESLGLDGKVGLLERAERLIVLCVGLILTFLLEPLLWLLLAASVVTVVQRFTHVWRQARSHA